MSELCEPEDALDGLLHAGSEAFLGDLASPLKHSPHLAGFRRIEATVDRAIAERFGTRVGKPTSVAHADMVAAAMELRDLVLSGECSSSLPTDLPPEPLVPWSWQIAISVSRTVRGTRNAPLRAPTTRARNDPDRLTSFHSSGGLRWALH